MLKLWGRINSINVQKVLWALEELRVPYERTDAGLQYGVVNEPFYRKMNPNGRVPTIEDDGLVLWESNAIVRYLAGRYGAGGLCPQDAKVRADADRWMDWQQTTIAPPMVTLFWGYVRTPPEKRDPAALEAARKQAAGIWPALERTLEKRPYVAGEQLTMGDIPVGCMVHRWFALPIERPNLPALAAWYERLKQRPGYRYITIPMT